MALHQQTPRSRHDVRSHDVLRSEDPAGYGGIVPGQTVATWPLLFNSLSVPRGQGR
jgi:hypothetical protein